MKPNRDHLSIVHLCDNCLGPFLVSKGYCSDCSSTGYHYSTEDEPPRWLWLMPMLPVEAGLRVRHRMDLTVGYVRAIFPPGFHGYDDADTQRIEILWDCGNGQPTIVQTRSDLFRVDLEDPSASAYGYALRWAWSLCTKLPDEVPLDELGELLRKWHDQEEVTDEDRLTLAKYCDKIDLWRPR